MKGYVFALLASLAMSDALAEPSRIVLLRHGEKENAYALCDVGQQRSLALRAQYLGKDAKNTLFTESAPAAFFAITLHTLELAAPAADSWGLPVISFASVPLKVKGSNDIALGWVARQTQRAAVDVMNNPHWQGKTVVMVWEHKHIANEKLVKNSPDELVDLRQLLKLDRLPEPYLSQVPKTWSGSNYNFFWIIDYDSQGEPVIFRQVKQAFTGDYASLPNNDWGDKEPLPIGSHCE